ncbi:butyrophilin subfamily 2 member A2 [Oryzias melastigma]|uniref:butyrophilin subfamily 2 member A2 n=1 Tax=Oryzias melastigma TaxID=30732 RepID=UPI000CF8297F|nr:butyrophilin subfamily 2 member A2 [Oryzias melastigma]
MPALLMKNASKSPTMWFCGLVLLLVLVGSPVSGTSNPITAEPGDDVTLRCEDPNIDQKPVFEWTRTDLQEKENVFFYRDNRPYLDDQHESFKNRVSLKNSQMKDGDLSVVLKNVTVNDTGTYQCRVLKGLSADQNTPISTILLSVSPPGEEGGGGNEGGKDEQGGGGDKDQVNWSLLGLIVLPVLVLALGLVLVGLWIYRKKKGSNQSSRGSNDQKNPECGLLNSDSKAGRNATNI